MLLDLASGTYFGLNAVGGRVWELIDGDGLTLDQIERLAVDGAIAAAQGSLPAAARILGVSPSTLYRKRERWEEARVTA